MTVSTDRMGAEFNKTCLMSKTRAIDPAGPADYDHGFCLQVVRSWRRLNTVDPILALVKAVTAQPEGPGWDSGACSWAASGVASPAPQFSHHAALPGCFVVDAGEGMWYILASHSVLLRL